MGNLETRAALAQAFRFLDALAGEGLGQQMEDGTTLFADKCCEDLERALGADFRAGWPDIAAHMIAPPAMDREAVARIVNPSAFTSRQSLYDYCISQGDTEEDARRIADDTHKPDCDKALAKADAILSTLSADAIRQGEGEAKAVIAKIAEAAHAIGIQAGVGGRETAGAIVSYLMTSPEEIEPFINGKLSPVDFKGDWISGGSLSWHASNGRVVFPATPASHASDGGEA